nr:MAG TPA: hypothetical protein [Caudoviricetes sp.]
MSLITLPTNYNQRHQRLIHIREFLKSYKIGLFNINVI